MRLMTRWPETGMAAPETGACCLVPETMTHLASKWYRQKKNKHEFRFYRNSFFLTVLWVEKYFRHSTSSFIFVYKQTSSAIVCSDWPITV